MRYKGKNIHPYESFYWNTTERFFQGQLGGGISRCVKTDASLAIMEEVKIAAMRGRNPENPSERGKSNGKYKQRLEINENGTTNTLTSVQKDNLVVEPQVRIRKLTPRECFRLMGVDDEDIDKIQASGISNSSQYKLAGNSIVVDVLYHIFRKAFTEKENEAQQLTFDF